MQYLKQSTVATLKLGPFVDNADYYTPEVGLTISQADVMLSKNGGAFTQKTESTACTHDNNGWYGCPIDATDTATLGRLQVAVYESGALPVHADYTVLAANVYDSLIGGGDLLDVNTKEVSDDSAAADNLESACDNYSVTRGLTGTALPAAVADAAGGVPVSDAGALDLDAMNTNVDAILVDTAEIGTAGVGLIDLGGMSTSMKAEVNVEAKDVLFTDTMSELSAIPAANASVADKICLMAMITRNGGNATSSQLQVNKDNGSALGTTTVNDDDTTFTRGELS